MAIYLRLAFILLNICCSLWVKAEIIKVAGIDWCPQICINDEKPGYVVELVNEVFKGTKYSLEIDHFPWSRAIKNVLQGKYDALLAPAKAEAPNLIYPKHEVGKQRMCFFTKKSSQWSYSGPESLANLQIGIAVDTSIEELNEYVKNNLAQFQFQPYHERYVLQNARKLDKKRTDTFLMTKNTTLYSLSLAGLADRYREAGCVSNTSIFMAFTPELSKKNNVEEMTLVFDRRMAEIYNTSFIDKLMRRYGL
ncbi:MAG: transporter substrate-binding domain-containing protein [Colwellia sp.]|nr:transporter substrate-binding domain-containing protein [Colwellia sp.]